MSAIRLFSLLLLVALVVSGCRKPPPAPTQPALEPPTPVEGTIVVDGLSQPVTVVRDRWGIPHITARNEDDLFLAQGFIQAQDRLFQMDLWRRASLGRLAAVLGPNFIDRDAMTARVQYHGAADVERNSYSRGTSAIVDAFVAGVNRWVERVRERRRQEFVLAGWSPDFWAADDLFNRTDAFLESRGADLEAFRAQLIAEVGVPRVNALLPSLAERKPWPVADLAAAGDVVAEALRRAGAAPVFSGFAAPFAGSNAWAIPASRSSTGSPVLASDPHRPLTSPSLRYLVHLKAPGWNVIGATAPWLPGVAIGHNDHVAWGMAAAPVDTQDVLVERDNSQDVFKDALVVSQKRKVAFERAYTKHGVVIASDREHQLVFTLGWTGFEPGAAAELGALGLDRAQSIGDLQAAVAKWKMPVVDVVFADRHTVGRLRSGEHRQPGSTPTDSVVIAANENTARTRRLQELLAGAARYSIDDVKRQQQDVMSWNAERLLPRLASLHADEAAVETARRELVAWNRRVTPESSAAALYVAWEDALWRATAAKRVPPVFVDAYVVHVPFEVSQVVALADAELLTALASAVTRRAAENRSDRGVVFRHPLALTQPSRRLFDVGPFSLGGYRDTVMSFSRTSRDDAGASFRQILDVADWDRSVVTNAPGQSERTSSRHFSDLATLWSTGEYFPLAFSDRAIQENAESTLVLQPMK